MANTIISNKNLLFKITWLVQTKRMDEMVDQREVTILGSKSMASTSTKCAGGAAEASLVQEATARMS